jgi:transketolase C-terminal domain/subunit
MLRAEYPSRVSEGAERYARGRTKTAVEILRGLPTTVVPLVTRPRRLVVQVLLQQSCVLAVRLPREVEQIAEKRDRTDYEIMLGKKIILRERDHTSAEAHARL